MKYAHGIVSEYLPEDLSVKLYQHLKLPPDEAVGLKRKSVMPAEQKDGKKLKTGDENGSSDAGKDDSSDVSKYEKVCKSTLYVYKL